MTIEKKIAARFHQVTTSVMPFPPIHSLSQAIISEKNYEEDVNI